MRVKILIIEDDPIWSIFIETTIQESNYELIGSANTISKAKALIDGYKPDVVISDIRIQNSTVFDFLLEEIKYDFPILFMTSHLDGDIFDMSTKIPKSTYLVKPFHKFSLLAALDLLISKYPIVKSIEESFITVRGNQQQIKKIGFSEITWIEAKGNYCYIHTESSKKYVRKKSLKSFVAELDSRFLRIHKAFVVNQSYINRIELSNNLIIIGNDSIPLGRHYRSEFNKYLQHKN